MMQKDHMAADGVKRRADRKNAGARYNKISKRFNSPSWFDPQIPSKQLPP
jgi:hypothetical protein